MIIVYIAIGIVLMLIALVAIGTWLALRGEEET